MDPSKASALAAIRIRGFSAGRCFSAQSWWAWLGQLARAGKVSVGNRAADPLSRWAASSGGARVGKGSDIQPASSGRNKALLALQIEMGSHLLQTRQRQQLDHRRALVVMVLQQQ